MAKVLIIEDEAGIGELVHAILTDEGFDVSVLQDVTPDAIRVAVGQLEPDCVLLDGHGPADYGESWTAAAWMHVRSRSVPVIMFSASPAAVREAEENRSARSRGAHFAAILAKPFDIDQLIETVRSAIGASAPFDRSEQAESRRTAALIERLRAAGADDIHASTRREWANFRNGHGAQIQLYWWQHDGVYCVVRHEESGGVLRLVGRFYDLDAAVALAMTVGQPAT